jgi:hypothetical protein
LQPDILGLITELAVYEKEPDAVKATPELVSNSVMYTNLLGYFPAEQIDRLYPKSVKLDNTAEEEHLRTRICELYPRQGWDGV